MLVMRLCTVNVCLLKVRLVVLVLSMPSSVSVPHHLTPLYSHQQHRHQQQLPALQDTANGNADALVDVAPSLLPTTISAIN